MDGRTALMSAVPESPADDAPRLVLADLLRESPDPADVAPGRLLWAGVTAHGFRSDELIDDPLYYAAQREIAAVASAGLPARWVAVLGLGPHPLTPRDWGWDCTLDRVTVRVGNSAGVFARGLLAELAVALGEWYAVAGAAIASWPVELVTVADVPGLAFAVEKAEAGWRLAARVKLPGRRVPLARGRVIPAAVSPVPVLADGPADRRVEEPFPDREALVAGVGAVSASLVADLRDVAGDRWPLPPRKR